ncbi:3-beta hydroxysteroid dehydrogenase/isomerase family protein [Penicillium pulvis]|uniref:3-beta hydroxysteroid dehydrogenase/isomerase family protein n=1 Tax=Penicillium pulvis TaxID=1562058 RepID=UPI002546BD80|nr:3-beta hydroxysteroid dehydrogenase/isomerase family protein [Penicillium pulvis]KAJ5785568.1 3-beta hydroxysteroid dehydrogenase/isomerase family protein [Penicillium pulvis]
MTYILVPAALGLAGLYLRHVNTAMKRTPEEALHLSPHRWTIEEVKAAYEKASESPVDVTKSLPPKQTRRYVVVGGSGLVGGWIVQHLLSRGEDPSAIRILDLHAPTKEVLDLGVTHVKTNITDKLSVDTAFEQPWPNSVAGLPLTVFHTAAIIRPQDRLEVFLPLCSNVNVEGTRNVVNAAKENGTSCFISTSSGSVGLHRPDFWIAPWEKLPKRVTQVWNDDAPLPQRHDEFFGNYAVTKVEAERLVRSEDNLSSNFRTGCIRPANGIYGIGSDVAMTITGVYLRTGGSPTWLHPIIQSFVNAENVSIAHLLYEQRLVEQSKPGSQLPNIGGQAFIVTDPNPAISFSDVYTLLVTLAKTPIAFPIVQPIYLFLLAYVIEAYSFVQFKYLSWLLPKITGDLAQVQPSLFAISDTCVFADDSRAKKSPEEGGLGYNPPLTTLDGMCKEVLHWNKNAVANGVVVEEKIGPVRVTENGVDVNLVAPGKI